MNVVRWLRGGRVMGREFSGVICEPSLEIPQHFIAGLSQRWSPEYRVENIGINSSKLQSGIILYKRIHNSG